MTDSARLTCNSAARNCADNVELADSIGKIKRLTNDKLKRFKTEVIVDISSVNGNVTVTRVYSYSGYRIFLLPVP